MKKIAIVGGGIIGMYIALKLKEKNLDVFLYDKKKEEDIGFKPCSTLVSERIKDFISFSTDCIENTIDVCKINFPKKTIELNFNPKHLVLSREKLIKEQLALLKKAGVNVKLGESIKSIPLNFDYVIGCDGPNSIIRKELGIKDPEMRIGMQVFINQKNNSHCTDVFPVHSGFIWKIPRGNSIEYGILSNSKKIKEIFNDFLKKQGIDKRDMCAALIPLGMVFSNNEKIALCGDAMGLTKPWSGGGIIWELTAAEILINTFPDFKEYEKQTKRFFNYKMIKGVVANKIVNIIGFHFPYIIPSKINYDNDFPDFIKSMLSVIAK